MLSEDLQLAVNERKPTNILQLKTFCMEEWLILAMGSYVKHCQKETSAKGAIPTSKGAPTFFHIRLLHLVIFFV